MKRVLIIDNSALNITAEGCCVNIPNAKFAAELKKLGNEVSWSQFGIAMHASISNSSLEKVGIKCFPIRMFQNKIIRYLYAYLFIIRLILKQDFVYIFYPNSFRYITIACKLLRKPFGLYLRGMNQLDDKFSHWAYKNANVVLSGNELFTQLVNKIAKRDVAKTVRPLMDLTCHDIQWNKSYQEDKCRYKVLLLSRITKDKGLVELIEACKILKDDDEKFSLSIVGDGDFAAEGISLSKKLGLEDVVTFYGPVYDKVEKQKIYEQSDIYILPTYHEGFPRTLYEAMIYGTPIITTFVGGIPCLMKNGYNCMEIKAHSVESIVTQLKFAFHNYPTMVQLAKNAFGTVASIVDDKRPTHAQDLHQRLNNL